jgi:membrane-bound ClpP family serine protease
MSINPINRIVVLLLLAALLLLLIAGIVPSTTFPTGWLGVPGIVCLVLGIVLVIRNRTHS